MLVLLLVSSVPYSCACSCAGFGCFMQYSLNPCWFLNAMKVDIQVFNSGGYFSRIDEILELICFFSITAFIAS